MAGNRSSTSAPFATDPIRPSLTAQRLRRINLDLLPILQTLLQTCSVTKTARQLGISQPAVSKALRQLREVFNDDLIVSRGREGRLTERGLSLLSPLSGALSDLDLLLEPPRPFDPASERLRIVIKTADYVSVLLAPQLARLCAEEAPHTELLFLEQGPGGKDEAERVDFMIAPRTVGPIYGKRVEHMPLWRDEMVCIASSRDDRWRAPVSTEAFRAARQVVYQVGERGPLARAGLIQPTSILEVQPICEVPNFLVIGAIVEEAQAVALVPRKLARELARSRAIRILDIDYPERRLDIDAFWMPRAGARRGHPWFRALLQRAVTNL